MARSFNANVANYLKVATALNLPNPAGTALTVHAWVKPNNVTNNGRVCCRFGTTGGERQFLLAFNNASKLVVAVATGTGTQDAATGATNVSTGAWHAVALLKNGTGAGALQAWLDGASDASITSNVSMGSLAGGNSQSACTIGLGSDVLNPLNGDIGEVCIWKKALSAAELVALSKGVNSLLIRRADIVGYWPLWMDLATEPDLSGSGAPMTRTGSVPLANHCPVGPAFFPPPGMPIRA